MTLTITLQPAFLRQRLQVTRIALVGKSTVGKPVAAPRMFTLPGKVAQKVRTVSKTALNKIAMAAIILSLSVGAALLGPRLYYSVIAVETIPVQAQENGTVLGGNFAEGTQAGQEVVAEPEKTPYLPPKDDTLPEGKWLIIPRIGVRTELQETEDPEEALATGVWKVPGYGEVGSTDLPVILAAHRFGWEWWWQSDYWKYNSFYLLPDTEPGDIVEIIDDQRKWTYEIYGGAEGDEIADYDADLILYTCKFLNSPVRHFRYARLIDPTADSQS